ncbi:MAG: pilus assembly FimT family protein [Candidatus Aminicenantia bacterium]
MKNKGFNLVETTISLSLISIFMFLSFPAYKTMISKLNFKSGQSLVLNSLYLARYKSALSGESIRWKASGKEILIEKKLKEKWLTERKIRLDYGEVLANNTPIFHPEGLVTNMATIQFRDKKRSSKITISITGRIKVIDENN